MKIQTTIKCLALAVLAVCMAFADDPFDRLREAANRRRIIAQQSLADGRIVQTILRNGVRTVETNTVPEIVGTRQLSPFEERMQTLEDNLSTLRAKYIESTNDMAKVWADYHAATNLNSVSRAKLIEARDNAKLTATKAVIQKLIDTLYPEEAE